MKKEVITRYDKVYLNFFLIVDKWNKKKQNKNVMTSFSFICSGIDSLLPNKQVIQMQNKTFFVAHLWEINDCVFI